MKVHVLLAHLEYEGDDIIGIYDSEQKAIDIKIKIENHPSYFGVDKWIIREYELNIDLTDLSMGTNTDVSTNPTL